jgi:hypothetical protein
MESQTKMIKAHLESGKTITAIEALSDYACFRLASRISDLKKSGYLVDKRMIELPNGKRVAQYFKVYEL